MFALELEVPHGFRPVFDLDSLGAGTYANNPALKIPVWVDEQGPLFGVDNICRELVRRSGTPRQDVVLRADVSERLVANAEELTLHVMASEVSLIMAKGAHGHVKLTRSVEHCLDYLDQNIAAVLAVLPSSRRLSFVEVALFCVLRHLPFREVMAVTSWTRLGDFCDRFGERESARATDYRFDTR